MEEHLHHIGKVIVHGVLFDPKNRSRLQTMDPDSLLNSISRLFDVLDDRGVDYVVVGGIAMLAHVDARNTQDIDLIVSREALDRLPEIVVDDDNIDFAHATFSELEIDLLFAENKLFEKVRRERSVIKRFAERRIRCASVDAIVLLKLYALPSLYRQARFDKVDLYQSDILRLLREFNLDTGPLFAELTKHMLPSDIVELQRIVAQIQTEIADSRRRFLSEE